MPDCKRSSACAAASGRTKLETAVENAMDGSAHHRIQSTLLLDDVFRTVKQLKHQLGGCRPYGVLVEGQGACDAPLVCLREVAALSIQLS